MKIILALLALTFLALTSAKKLSILDVLRAVEDAGDGNFEIVLRRKRTVGPTFLLLNRTPLIMYVIFTKDPKAKPKK